jgi:hypothetical protein
MEAQKVGWWDMPKVSYWDLMMAELKVAASVVNLERGWEYEKAASKV